MYWLAEVLLKTYIFVDRESSRATEKFRSENRKKIVRFGEQKTYGNTIYTNSADHQRLLKHILLYFVYGKTINFHKNYQTEQRSDCFVDSIGKRQTNGPRCQQLHVS